jgi:hypothetical protein
VPELWTLGDIRVVMKNIQITSRKTDLKVLFVVVFSAVAGFLLPSHFEISYYARFFDAVFSVPVALLVWCAFHLVEPRRHSKKWTVAEFMIVPLVWLLLMVALDVWFHHL